MTTTWTGNPILSAASINELRTAVYKAGGTPAAGWIDGTPLSSTASLKPGYFTELRDAIQAIWNKPNRTLGLVPNWTSGVEPGHGTPAEPAVVIRRSDIHDLRRWFNHYETWGDLRGVHWWKYTTSDSIDPIPIPKVGWNEETVIGVTKDGKYNSGDVTDVHSKCERARNYGLVNIVRLDWGSKKAVPTPSEGYTTWIQRFTSAVNTLKDVATIFIVGNEPTVEPEAGITGGEYAAAFNALYANKVPGTMYLAAGPAAWSITDRLAESEVDTVWLKTASSAIRDLDGWALHTYGSPYLNYAHGVHRLPCYTPDVPCPIEQDAHRRDVLVGDASFRRYRDYIEVIRRRWAFKPVYLTETNTYGYKHDFETPDATPAHSYIAGWTQRTYQEIRSYNSETNSNRLNYPRILCLCWFVDDDRADTKWEEFALSNGASHTKLGQARKDFIASDTSTGLTDESRGRIPIEVPDPRWPGVSELSPTIG